ncbi:hypothetical protein [Micromonospora sp. WMMD980]|uniref:hypothetical protein n=1 Tax=Micromonospora sp. WMMD980 TaxID=3016088 RepID=UPI0024168C11|nr:hypothetical protein [Micromonospora sp. WMMD980]MDG4801212.1 hypothetical protein [Micromonospora sp. WMMD980]
MVRPVTNAALEALLHAAGYRNAHGALARQLNHAGRRYGTWRYDAASVYWWLRGRRPSDLVQEVMAGTIARKLGRPVAVRELGFADATPALNSAYPTSARSAIDAAQRLWAILATRPNSRPGEEVEGGTALQAAIAWRYDLPDKTVASTGRQPVTTADVETLHVLADHFLDLDRRHGGGSHQARALMADLLVRQVTPMLGGTYTDAVGHDFMRAVATLSGQLAFMCYDAGDHAIAQHHLIIALRLAKATDDRLLGAHLLANLATQAMYLGHAQDAARLAEAAIDGAGRAPATVRARLYTTAASAYGRSGEKRACQNALGRAERAVDRSHSAGEPRWVGYFTPAHFAGAALGCLGDLQLYRQALRHAPDAIALAPQNTRTRALHTALIATTHVRAGDLDAACSWGRELAHHARDIHSVRVTRRVRELARSLGRHRTVPEVEEVLLTINASPPQ